jgi:phage terminase large subunit-like protein
MTPEEEELIRRAMENWTPDARERALAEFQARQEKGKQRRVWYCATPGRTCTGRPHDGYPYPHARSDQWPPPGSDWFIWALVGGRGSGKTRSGAEYVRQVSKRVGRVALIARTGADVRDTMIEGESGLVAVFEAAGEKIIWQPALRKITFPNGSIATTFSAEEPDRLRGPQHGFAWLDEPAHYDQVEEVWDNLLMGLRLGARPHVAITTTPLPKKWMKERLAEPTTVAARVSTYANLDNLAPTFAQTVLQRYEGTRIGRQELHGEILADVEGALWQEPMLRRVESVADLDRIIVSVDPAGTANKRSDETGIVVVGRRGKEGFVLEDRSGKYSPQGWSEMADRLYRKWHADAIVAEKNFGGDMVKTTVESSGTNARIKITTAARSKALRAEPVVALYEQGRISHVGRFPDLEEEQLTWVPGQGDSPNRVDALVWGFTELFEGGGVARLASTSRGERRLTRPNTVQTVPRPGMRRTP